VELLAVVLILGALAYVAIPRIGQSVDDAKQKACEENMRLLNAAIERYYATNGTFPGMLRDIKRDKDLFPDGPPVCPITGERYSGMNAKHRVRTALHNH